MSHTLSVYVVYDHPTDYPEWFVCRRWDVVEGGSMATDDFTMSMDYESIKTRMEAMGLTKLFRHPKDDPKISRGVAVNDAQNPMMPDARKTFDALWSFGAEFAVVVDRTKPGVTMPDFVEGNPVIFKLGSQSRPSIPIVSIDDESVVVSLVFTNAGRQSFEPVVIPWAAVVTYIANQSALNNHVAKAMERGEAVTRKFGVIDGGKKGLPS